MSSAAVERAKHGDVATEASGPEEKAKAEKVLETLTSTTAWTRDNVVASLTIPPGEEYLETTLVRFLRARNGDVTKAATMMDEALTFRKRHDVDNLLNKPMSKELLRHVRLGVYDGILSSFDNFGRPVYMLRGGLSNEGIHEILKKPHEYTGEWSSQALEDAFMHWHIVMQEYLTRVLCAEATAKAGRLINKYLVIDDLKGLSLHGIAGVYKTIGYFKKTAYIDQLLYPEMMSMFMIINSSALFRAPWKLISSFLDGDTVRKIFILGGPSQYLPPLEAVLSKDKRPDFLGGTLPGAHVTTVNTPDTVIFDRIDDICLANAQKNGFDIAQRCAPLKQLTVAAKAVETITSEVSAGETIEWQLTVDAHDIGLRVFFKPSDSQEIEVIDEPEKKHQSSDVRLHMSYVASTNGLLTIEVSNKHSRFRSKSVSYRVYTWQSKVPAQDAELPNSDNVSVGVGKATATASTLPVDAGAPAVPANATGAE
ncbi:Phosphatidylinositol/phosphatidylcholine transfer protein SFH2 [Hondaea fermentalgiana]|uniref:Phosphatidylinositol/phosphatidylcholine transfer protein SFH2 n=1 Tax=Hondaea fermentalgiana TaxID=2315210 RepID=A0A2R5GST4_9STRA|nr:Phosphatidylinositol/phosphatidylcholine transfer protein SFH2 [Hondaea fermentalgiana]|eukprot:GBG33937.1 Phosphatidylinositol/phosphatidylcholine transfer protein SFH2 [Hondaea fermentalgiana]